MAELYPLKFQPILKRYLWGGRRLASVLGKSLPPGDDYAESWEIVDRATDQSVVANGPLAGTTLRELMQSAGPQLLGRHWPLEKFPLLFKFLDAHQQLSIQVHPDDALAAQLNPPDLGKTEAWVVIAAEPGSYIYAGLKPGIDAAQLANRIAAGDCEECVERLEVEPGDCFFLAAGVVHALGPGLVVAEIQQSSDTTYRLFDWNRRGPDGKTRQLHVEQGLAAIDFEHGPVRAQPRPTGREGCERLVECDQFVLQRWTIDRTAKIGGDDRFRIVAVISGCFELDRSQGLLATGDVVLLPASWGAMHLECRERGTILEAYLP